MKKERTKTEEYIECDGCQYVMGKGPMIVVSVPFDFPFDFLQDDGKLEFHFHAIEQRHDCFRYWAHSPQVMRQSLKNRSLDEDQIDAFMELMLYRQHSWSPGIEREPKKTVA